MADVGKQVLGDSGERLAPEGSRPRGSCSKQCHAIGCESLERHGCHDKSCRERFGLEPCPRCACDLAVQSYNDGSASVHCLSVRCHYEEARR
jgi:hypothetical protein